MTGIAIGAAFVAGIAFGFPAVVATGFVVVALRATGRVSPIWAMAVLACAVGGMLRATPEPETHHPAWSDEAEAVRGAVVSGPMSADRGQRFNLRVDEYRTGYDWQSTETVICVTASELPEVRRGDRLFQVVTVQRLEDLPAGVAHAYSARGCSATATAWRTTVIASGRGWEHSLDGLRRSMSNRLQAAAPGDAGSLLAGLVAGDDGALSDDARTAFVETGTTHITSVSGSNLAIVLVSAMALGGKLGLHRRIVWQVVTAGGVWSYALLVGLEPPALRAAIVATGAVFAVSFGRRADLVTLTTIAATVQLAVRPGDFWSLSFRLSFVSALALALVLRGISATGVRGSLRAGFVATAAAQVATAPVLISSFGRISPLSLPANVLIAPFVAIAFPIALLASLLGFLSESLGEACAAPAALSADAVLWLVNTTSGIQGEQQTIARPGVLGNLAAVAGSSAMVALFSLDCRRALGRGWRWGRARPYSRLVLGGLGGAGFVIGLVIGAAR